MFEKLSTIANYADRSGQYEFANYAASLMKNAQLFDALKALFDPEAAGLDRDTGYWKRLQRGWQRGKMDRHLGLVLAIMAERTKINKKIDLLAAPIKGFGEQVNAFYDKLRSDVELGDRANLKQELRSLQDGLRDMLKLVAGKELRNALRLREKLQEQQVRAAEKIKGLDEDSKANLIAILSGEKKPESSIETAKEKESSISGLRLWLTRHKIPRLPMTAGASTKQGRHQFREFTDEYGYNPKAIADFFNDNGELQGEGIDRFPKIFSEMLRRANQILMYDDELSRGVHRSSPKKEDVPGAETKTSPGGPLKESLQPTTTSPLEELKEENFPDLKPILPTEVKPEALPVPRQTARKKKETLEDEKKKIEKLRGALRAKHLADPAPVVPVPTTTVVDPKTSSSRRLERQISCFGRGKTLEKIAVEIDPEIMSKYDSQCNCENSACEHSALGRGCPNPPGKQRIQYIGTACDECAAKLKDYWIEPQDEEEKNGFMLLSDEDKYDKDLQDPESLAAKDILPMVGDHIIYNTEREAYVDASREFGSMNGLRIVPVTYTGSKENPKTLEIEDKDIFDANPEGQERYDENKEYEAEHILQDEDDIDFPEDQIHDLRAQLKRIERRIKILELDGQSDKSKDEIKKLHVLSGELMNRISKMEDEDRLYE